MERSKSFVKALQELKSLRPQLYSAAEYCEKSCLHSEKIQMVLDNMKDYTVRAFVNAVDHLGTVACKLNALLEQQSLEISSVELKVVSLNQKLLTCQTYTDKEGVRQQRLLAVIPRYHKHYILPNSVNKKAHVSPYNKTKINQSYIQARPHPSAKTLSWHLNSETSSSLKQSSHDQMSSVNAKFSFNASGDLHQSDAEDGSKTNSSVPHLLLQGGNSTASTISQTFAVTGKDYSGGSKHMKPLPSLNRPHLRVRSPAVRSRNMLSSLFAKHKISRLKTGHLQLTGPESRN